MTTEKFNVMVLVEEGSKLVWKPVKPTGGEPYKFTEQEAQSYVQTYSLQSGMPERYKIERV